MTREPGIAIICLFWILFVLPEVSLPLLGVSKLTFSLALPIFLIWYMMNIGEIKKLFNILIDQYPLNFGFCVFSLWGVIVSCASLRSVSILYSVYHAIFVITSTLIIAQFLEIKKIPKFSQPRINKQIYIIGGIVAIGSIISVWTGPIYPHQTLWTAKHWNAESAINTAVGFSSNPNQNALYLSFFLFYMLLINEEKLNIYKIFSPLIVLTALFCTLSRTGIAAVISATSFLTIIILAKSFKTLRMPKWTLFYILTSSGVIFAYLLYISNLSSESGLFFGFSGQRISDDLLTRASIWQDFIERYQSGSFFDFIFGNGRRSSSVLDYWGTWFTPHNAFLSILSEYGLVGFSIIIFILFVAIIRLSLIIMKNPDSHSKYQQFSLLFLVSITVASNAEEHLLSPINGVLVTYALFAIHFTPKKNQSLKGIS